MTADEHDGDEVIEPIHIDGMPDPVDDRYRYWTEQPPQLSERCRWWLDYLPYKDHTVEYLLSLDASGNGYDENAERMGVYLWEYLHILTFVWSGAMERAQRLEAMRAPAYWDHWIRG